ncbi:MAG: hypothetical protein ACPHID_06125 [Thermoplasmatota archaeon]
MKARVALALLMLLAVPVQAVSEADAPSVDPRIAAVGHEPAMPQPGEQWDGYIQFHEGHNVTDVIIKVCRVAVFCNIFGPEADQVDANTWRFNTAGKTFGGGSVEWGINDDPGDDSDWLIGVQYYIFTTDMEVNLTDGLSGDELEQAHALPTGQECGPELDRDAWAACEEGHYFTFLMEGRPRATAEAPAPFLLVPLIGALLWARSRRA